LAGKSTLNRLELTLVGARAEGRYKKIVARHPDLESWFIEAFLQLERQAPGQIELDLDATDDPVHDHQLAGSSTATTSSGLRGASAVCQAAPGRAAGSERVVERIVTQIRRVRPDVRIILRGDSVCCRESLMSWCEAGGVDYLFVLAKNARLRRIIGRQMHQARLEFQPTQQPCRQITEFFYQTRKS
jgi:hypothetical protein